MKSSGQLRVAGKSYVTTRSPFNGEVFSADTKANIAWEEEFMQMFNQSNRWQNDWQSSLIRIAEGVGAKAVSNAAAEFFPDLLKLIRHH